MKLNRKLEKIKESATLALNAKAKSLAKSGRKIFNLTAGELDFPTHKSIQAKVALRLSESKYTDTLGIYELREKIAGRLNFTHSLKLVPQNVAVTAGAKQGLFAALSAILNPGDEVIIPTPVWVSYENQVVLAGGKPVFAGLSDDFDLDAKAIKKLVSLRTKAVIINTPHNPTGKIFSEKKLKELFTFLKNKRIFIITDEIYRTLSFGTKAKMPSDMIRNIKKLIIVDGFSKSHALTGWRIGFVAADLPVIENINKYLGHTSGNVSVMSQVAALACLEDDKATKEYVKLLRAKRALVAKLLNEIKKISYTVPGAAFYFFVNIGRVSKNSVKFCEELLRDEGVAVVPGEAFRAPGFIRISFTAPEATLQKGLSGLKRFIEKQ
ncbi:MAG TPA: pyridoxal phosphate-dependent aminotransferase [Candidatus Paceibacterota bacterium]